MTNQELEGVVTELTRRLEDMERQVRGLVENPSLDYTEKLRLSNALNGIKIYFVADTSGGTVDRELTFKDGILTSED